MRNLLCVLLLSLVGCAPTERYVKVAAVSQAKSVSIYVKAITMQLTFIADEDGVQINESTAVVKVSGAGVFISPQGHVLTCAHLLSFDKILDAVVISYNGDTYKAEVLFKEDRLDLALLKINPEKAVPYARIADPRKLKVGQEVIAIGSPLGLDFTVSHGIISALYRDDLDVPNMTQSDAFINPGNSGGPLFNLNGELVGINSRMSSPIDAAVFTGLGFSVQCGQIIEFLTRFRGIDKAIPKYDLHYWTRFFHEAKLGSH